MCINTRLRRYVCVVCDEAVLTFVQTLTGEYLTRWNSSSFHFNYWNIFCAELKILLRFYRGAFMYQRQVSSSMFGTFHTTQSDFVYCCFLLLLRRVTAKALGVCCCCDIHRSLFIRKMQKEKTLTKYIRECGFVWCDVTAWWRWWRRQAKEIPQQHGFPSLSFAFVSLL